MAINKPAGLIAQGAPRGGESAADWVKAYLKQKYDKPGNVYLGVCHRLDRPVSGVLVFARNSKAAARLSEQFRERQVAKVYLAVLERPPQVDAGTLTDWLLRDREAGEVRIVSEGTPQSKPSHLTYRTLGRHRGRALVEIDLGTGRMHQIRVQFASRGWAVVGDTRYGAAAWLPKPGLQLWERPIALHARSLTLKHPIRYDELKITAPVPDAWRQLGFDAATLP